MIYIDRSLFNSLVSGDKGRRRSNLFNSQVFVRAGNKVIKYSPGSFSILTLFTLAACGGTSGGSISSGRVVVLLSKGQSRGLSPLLISMGTVH